MSLISKRTPILTTVGYIYFARESGGEVL